MNSLTFPILRLLADGQFHSGEAIACHLGTTRATVWNALQEAQAMGVRIFSVRGRGYRLPEPAGLLDAGRVALALAGAGDRFTLEFHDAMPSTNSYLMQQAADGAPHGLCVIAELQTAGRGRRGRDWQTGLGCGLTFSVLWRFDRGAGALSGLSLAVGVALARALHELGMTEAELKWPNDLLHENRKLAGILIELQGDMDGPSAAIIGIGLNLRLPQALRRIIDQPATGLQDILGRPVDPGLGLGTILRHLAVVLDEFDATGFAGLCDEWMAHHAYADRAVRLLMPDGQVVEGRAGGVAADGALQVHTVQGMRHFSSGEISLREAP